jgi:hypothetical protein
VDKQGNGINHELETTTIKNGTVAGKITIKENPAINLRVGRC